MRTIELGAMITNAAIDGEATTIFGAPVARDPFYVIYQKITAACADPNRRAGKEAMTG